MDLDNNLSPQTRFFNKKRFSISLLILFLSLLVLVFFNFSNIISKKLSKISSGDSENEQKSIFGNLLSSSNPDLEMSLPTEDELYNAETAKLLIEKFQNGNLTQKDIGEHKDKFLYDVGEVLSIDKETKTLILKIFYSSELSLIGNEKKYILDFQPDNTVIVKGSDDSEWLHNKENSDLTFEDTIYLYLDYSKVIAILNNKGISNENSMRYMLYYKYE